jgi:hypothetical protein
MSSRILVHIHELLHTRTVLWHKNLHKKNLAILHQDRKTAIWYNQGRNIIHSTTKLSLKKNAINSSTCGCLRSTCSIAGARVSWIHCRWLLRNLR